MSKHTPGPWEARQDAFSKARGDNDPENRIYGANGHPIAVIRTTGMNGAEYEANARLIAAAPVTTETLLKFVIQAEALGWDVDPELAPLLNEGRAAIAKAKGGA